MVSASLNHSLVCVCVFFCFSSIHHPQLLPGVLLVRRSVLLFVSHFSQICLLFTLNTLYMSLYMVDKYGMQVILFTSTETRHERNRNIITYLHMPYAERYKNHWKTCMFQLIQWLVWFNTVPMYINPVQSLRMFDISNQIKDFVGWLITIIGIFALIVLYTYRNDCWNIHYKHSFGSIHRLFSICCVVLLAIFHISIQQLWSIFSGLLSSGTVG